MGNKNVVEQNPRTADDIIRDKIKEHEDKIKVNHNNCLRLVK